MRTTTTLRYILLILLGVCIAVTARAQGPGGGQRGGPPTAAQELAHLQKQLTLTDDQSAAILPILEKRHTDIDALMQSGDDRSTIGTQMRTIIDTSNKEIRALLTEAQQKIFDAMRPPKPPTSSNNESTDSSNQSTPPDGPPPNQQ